MNLVLRSYSQAPGGEFELKMSSTIFVDPSSCCSWTTMYFPTSVTVVPASGSMPRE